MKTMFLKKCKNTLIGNPESGVKVISGEFKNIPNFQGALFIFCVNMTFQNVFSVVNDITVESNYSGFLIIILIATLFVVLNILLVLGLSEKSIYKK